MGATGWFTVTGEVTVELDLDGGSLGAALTGAFI